MKSSSSFLASSAPLGIYNRLEPRPYNEDFQQSLRAEVHDALWMLTRQWQFGEFKGEDTGTAILAEVKMEYARLTRIASEGKPAQVLLKQGGDEMFPPEAYGEAEPVPFTWKTHLQWSMAWRKLLSANGCPSNMYDRFVQAFPLVQPLGEVFESDPQQKQWFSVLGGKVMDAGKFYPALVNAAGLSGILKPPVLDVPTKTKISKATSEMITWCEGLFFQPAIQPANPPTEPPAWNGDSMYYAFGMAALKSSTVREAYIADHSLGHLDWYSFDVSSNNQPYSALTSIGSLQNEANSFVSMDPYSFIPNPVQFPGMPASRFWEFENGRINLARMNVEASDFSKIMLAEFALVYSNDWQLLPFTLPFGSVCRITSIEMTDVFEESGIKVLPVTSQNNDWSFFNLNHLGKSTIAYNSGLLLPSIIPDLQESKPVELVRFIPSEVDNLLWALEDIVPDFLGEGVSAENVFKRIKNYLQSGATSLSGSTTITEEFWYQLMQEIPEVQFPYLPNSNNKLYFDRVKMKRQIDGVFDHPYVSPKGIVLRQTGSEKILRSSIPSTGVVLTRTFQRTRWKDGRIVTWLGRKKYLGHPSATAVLLYDQMIPSGK